MNTWMNTTAPEPCQYFRDRNKLFPFFTHLSIGDYAQNRCSQSFLNWGVDMPNYYVKSLNGRARNRLSYPVSDTLTSEHLDTAKNILRIIDHVIFLDERPRMRMNELERATGVRAELPRISNSPYSPVNGLPMPYHLSDEHLDASRDAFYHHNSFDWKLYTWSRKLWLQR